MSADRFEITDTNGLRIDGIPWRERGLLVQYAAIRQQARDIAELEVFAEIGRQWNTDSSLAKWFPLTAERVEQDAQEIAKLRTDLAAAVAERDKLRAIDCGWIAGQPPRYIGEEWFIAKTIHSERVVLRALGDGHSYDYTTADGTYMRAKNIVKWMQFPDSQYKSAAIAEITVRAEQAEARLAAIGAAPTVASLGIDHDGKHRGLYFPHPHRSALTMDAREQYGWTIQELIARPAKDQT